MVNPKYQAKDDDEWGLLAHTMEEASEVIKEGCKTLRWGFESYDPTDPTKEINAHRLIREMFDLTATAHRLSTLLEDRYPITYE